MEMEPTPPVGAKKLWSVVRIVFFMMKAGISKSKIMVDLHWMLKRGNKLAGKAIGNLILHHSSSFSCRSDDSLSFVYPKEYEFSCSNSPAFYPFYSHKRKHHHHAVQKVLDMLNNEAAVEASPLTTSPGFGRSPMVRQLRITDSPFPLKDDGDNNQVDKAAEEFIKKFYKDLQSQKRMSALDSPYHDSWGR
ncbi:uncharacterized protein LOC123194374 [Mangifera indica]|uniref:uncharacterized protein LOC123194374 n=1 Tax=Mangifera indica TaxID=29780 RepID=UPI001CFA6FA3|nr:uncharacterized protein LOC123194374 [Mangifera indica]